MMDAGGESRRGQIPDSARWPNGRGIGPGFYGQTVAKVDRSAVIELDRHVAARKFPRIQPRPKTSVDEVHTDRFGFDQHFAPT